MFRIILRLPYENTSHPTVVPGSLPASPSDVPRLAIRRPLMRHRPRPQQAELSLPGLRYPVTVHLPAEYVNLIDQALGPSQTFSKKGYKGRADVVRHAVYKFLVENGIQPTLDPSMIDAPKSRKRAETLSEIEFWKMLTQRH